MEVGADSCSLETFDGPTLLVLAKDCPSEELEHLRTITSLQLGTDGSRFSWPGLKQFHPPSTTQNPKPKTDPKPVNYALRIGYSILTVTAARSFAIRYCTSLNAVEVPGDRHGVLKLGCTSHARRFMRTSHRTWLYG